MSDYPPYGYGPSSPQWPGAYPPATAQDPSYPQQPPYPPPPGSGPAYYAPNSGQTQQLPYMPPGYPFPGAYPPPGYGMYPPPGMLPTYPDQHPGTALAGLIVGICALAAPVLAIILGIARLPFLPGVLFLASLPASIVGLVLSAIGRKSTTRHTAAITGLVLSIIALVLWILFIGLLILVVVIYLQRGQTT